MTRVLLSCVAVMVLGAVQAQEEFFEKYAFTKAMEHCMGTENYRNYLSNAQAAIQFCATQPRTRILAAQDVTYTSYASYAPFDNQGKQTPYRNNYGGGYFPTRAGTTVSRGKRHPLNTAGITTSRVKHPLKRDDTGAVGLTGIHSTTTGAGITVSQVKRHPFNTAGITTSRVKHPIKFPLKRDDTGFVSHTGGSGGSGQDGFRRPFNNNPFLTNSYQPDSPYIITGVQDNQRNYNSYDYRPSIFDASDIPVYRPFDSQDGGQLVDSKSLVSAADRFDSAMSNFTCVLAAVSAIDRDLSIKMDSFTNYYYSIQLDGALRHDLIQGVHFCNGATSCLQPDLLGIPLPSNLQRTMEFLKCEKKTRLAACLKHDIRRHISQFDVRVLPSDGGRTSDVDKLVTILVGSDASDDLDFY